MRLVAGLRTSDHLCYKFLRVGGGGGGAMSDHEGLRGEEWTGSAGAQVWQNSDLSICYIRLY